MWGILHITSDEYDAQIGPGDIHKFQKVVLIGVTTGLIASIIFHVVVKEGSNGSAGNPHEFSNFAAFYSALQAVSHFLTIFFFR